jgi:ATP-binding cassette subfamily B protein
MGLASEYDAIISYKEYEIDGDIELNTFNNSIKIENVTFSYGNTKNTINNINMEIKKGQRIGICGVSGGGKSTLLKLINRFYVPKSGCITIDGFDIQDISLKSYRKYIGSVHQDNTIFPGTIRDNIMYGSPYATEGELIDACKKANILDFILGLEKKFNTEVGPRGLTLSGGQKQRIALARLFIRNPEIILLDEATSALDNESETLIQDAVDNLEGKTIITIAHRLSTIKNCDIIYVLGNNGIVESGTHEELVAKHGVYYSMLK